THFKHTIAIEKLREEDSRQILQGITEAFENQQSLHTSCREIENIICSLFKEKEGYDVTFEKRPSPNGIGNNQLRRIVFKEDTREVTLGYLNMIIPIFGDNIDVYFKTTNE